MTVFLFDKVIQYDMFGQIHDGPHVMFVHKKGDPQVDIGALQMFNQPVDQGWIDTGRRY